MVVGLCSFSQNLFLHFECSNPIDSLEFLDHPKGEVVRDSNEAGRRVSEIIFLLFEKNFLSANCDSLLLDNEGNYHATICVGKRMVLRGIIDSSLAQISGQVFASKKHLWLESPVQVANLCRKILQYQENHGFPFSKILLKPFSLSADTVIINLVLEAGPYTVFDTIEQVSDGYLSPTFLQSYLGIKPGQPYSEELFKEVSNKLNLLSFVSQAKVPQCIFYRNLARVRVFIQTRKSSQFTGFLGVIPSNAITQKFLLTGDVKLTIPNMFASGALFDFYWRRFQILSSELKATIAYPYILGSSLGVDNYFSIFRQDSTFQELSNNFGLNYLLPGLNKIRFFYSLKRNTVTFSDNQIAQVKTSGLLPLINDYKSHQYGLQFVFEKLDNKLVPTSGFLSDVQASLGLRSLLPDAELNTLRFTNPLGQSYGLYDSINFNQLQGNVRFRLDYYLPTGTSSVFNMSLQGGSLVSPRIFRNEMFRFGGLNSLRGFDELSFYATSFSTLKIEYRYLLDRTTFFQLFCNAAGYQQKGVNNSIIVPVGTGAGISLLTPAGVFSVVYAIGKMPQIPIQLNSSKIHFGISNSF